MIDQLIMKKRRNEYYAGAAAAFSDCRQQMVESINLS